VQWITTGLRNVNQIAEFEKHLVHILYKKIGHDLFDDRSGRG